ncbi:MAG TPA: bifunctional phosphoribosylaminoimidazolecarboxamide formyltransferase/IMP cyclohydrolase [Candidatus Polarisedimenticolia bacterium]|nr:bifunctional phosphoribosylaminoimidazolecarboxamide formyltransferase/IMP cyclohydrolase [Candidatus Polarisedimenticolia bacterium]
MTPKKRALISVYDKAGVVDLAHRLVALGHTLLSTGGTAQALRQAGVPVVEISHYTGHPEILEGRVKTLHPKVHGGILADLAREGHRADMTRTGIEPIALVVVNLYPFREVASRPQAALDEVIEMIDVGGPAMLRAAAKNHRRVGVVVDPADYDRVLEELAAHGTLGDETRAGLAVKAFAHTAAYDAAIHDELARRFTATARRTAAGPAAVDRGPSSHDGDQAAPFPERLTLDLRLRQSLRYGENPHQRGALYGAGDPDPATVAGARQLQGKDLSFNNILDLDAAWRLALEFPAPAAILIKHNNPCGVAVGTTLKEAFDRARQTDPASAFGGIVAFNREVDAAAAEAVTSLFLECVIAPGYAGAARDILAGKPNLRVMEAAGTGEVFEGFDLRRVTGGFLVQDWDIARIEMARARVVTRRAPTPEEIRSLDFAWRVAKHVKSNAIVLALADRTIGIGAGQMSRVDSVRLAVMKAQRSTRGTVLASDAFFPFRDGLDEAAKAGITAVAQPGGSQKDPEVIAAADEHSLAMVFTGVRHFRH